MTSDSESGLSGKLVHVQYAEACEKRPGEPNPAIPCTSLSKDLVVEGLILKENFLSPEESEDTLNQVCWVLHALDLKLTSS